MRTRMLFRALVIFSSLICFAGSGMAQAPAVTKIEPGNEVIIEKNIMVAVGDGARLALDLYRPSKGGKVLAGSFPTLLVRTPYDKDPAGNGADGEYFASRGYVVAINIT